MPNGAAGTSGNNTNGFTPGGTHNGISNSLQTGGYALGGIGGANSSANTAASSTTGGGLGSSTGGSPTGGTYAAGGTNSAMTTGGTPTGGSYAAGGANSAIATGGSPTGGTYAAGGANSAIATGGSPTGGTYAAGGTAPGTNTGGAAAGTAGTTGGSAAANTGGYTAGGAGTGGNSGANTGGAGNGGIGGTGAGGATPTAPSVFSDTCRFTNVVVVEGTVAGDTLLAQTLASSVSNGCGAPTTIRQISQDAPGVLDTSGRPLVGPSELLVMCGGFVTQKAIAYLDQNDTPIYGSITAKNNHYTGFTRAGYQVFSIKNDSFTSSYDVGIIAVTYEPLSQTFVINIYGFNSTGTKAGVFYFANTLGPNLKNDPNHYYVVEWTDQDGDLTASAGDRFVVLASG